MKNDNREQTPLRRRMQEEAAVVFYNDDGSISLDVNHGEVVSGKESDDTDTIEETE